MKVWTHVLCMRCWYGKAEVEGQPGRMPTRVVTAKPQPCCACGTITQAGIFVRDDGAGLMCGDSGWHEREGDDPH